MVQHLLCTWLFIDYYEFGIEGAAIASSITNITSLAFTLLYVHFKNFDGRQKDLLHWFNKDSIKGWYAYLKLGIPSAAMLGLEWFCFELIAVIAGEVGVLELAAYTAMFNFFILIC